MNQTGTESAWRQSEDYFSRVEVQLQQRHEEILARRAALISGKEAFYDTNTGLPEIFIGSDAQARKRNEALFQTLQSIRHDLHQEPQENLSRLRKEYLQSVQDSMPLWISQLREFKLRQVQKIGEERWNADEDYQAIDAIIRYRPSPRGAPPAPSAASGRFVAAREEPPVVATVAGAAAAAATPRSAAGGGGSGSRQLAASVPDLSASRQSEAASAASVPPADGTGSGDGGSRRRGGRLGSFLSSSWSNLRARMARTRQPR